jgi:spore germination protein YaaH
MAVADYYHPHMYELTETNNGLRLKQRVNEKKESSLLNELKRRGIKALPMVSAFDSKNSKVVIPALEHPSQTAKLIAKEIRDEGYDGVAIDFESIYIGEERSARLVDFMRLLRAELPKRSYEITIAVSPRFAGSAENGYKHHGFYDLTALAPHVDFIELMAYDFHKGRTGASPVMPEDKLDDIVGYAKAHVVPSEKIVVLFPLYGGVWTKKGKFVGTLSARNTETYLEKAKTRRYDNGELHIVTSDGRIVYAQDETTFKARLDYLRTAGIQNAGAWRQTHGTKAIFNKLGEYKTNP